MYPSELGIFSIYLIVMFLLTLFTMWKYGKASYYNAFINYKKYRLLNMDSLVTLGSLSAFTMSVMLMVVYAHEDKYN